MGTSSSPRYKSIAPLHITASRLKFTCEGKGLLRDTYAYLNNAALQKFLKPVRTKTGKIAVRQPNKQGVAFWKAQCAFRSLPQTGSSEVLQKRLRVSKAEMTEKLAKAEKEANEEFWQKNAEAQEEKWKSLATDDEKASVDADRFMREKFKVCSLKSVQGSNRKKSNAAAHAEPAALLLKIPNYYRLEQIAGTFGLFHRIVEAPLTADGGLARMRKWIVVGREQSAVVAMAEAVKTEAALVLRTLQEEQKKSTLKRHLDVVSEVRSEEQKKFKKSTSGSEVRSEQQKNLKRLKASTAMTPWDVTGMWTIDCPVIEKGWGDGRNHGWLRIQRTVSKHHGFEQLWAEVDFILVNGIFRFVSSSTTSTPGRHDKRSKRKNESDYGSEDNHGSDDNYGSVSESSEDEIPETPEQFRLKSKEVPSPSLAQWNYRWRGEDSNTGEIELGSDRKLCSITFGGPGGSELSGFFISTVCGKVKFTGLKTGSLTSSTKARYSSMFHRDEYMTDIDYEWSNRDETAYESARTGRWG